ncbi:hypothetical protein Taro_011965, partial [Colocasia esculenta]|nr:hypothetical protein [Colocasia esculenta]
VFALTSDRPSSLIPVEARLAQAQTRSRHHRDDSPSIPPSNSLSPQSRLWRYARAPPAAAMPTIELKLSRSNRIYRPSEAVEGKIVTRSSGPIHHQEIRVRGGVAGVIESLYSVVKPISIVRKSIVVKPSGKLAPGTNEIPFSIMVSSEDTNGFQRFYETFHGANISIQYLITAEVNRGYIHKSLSTTVEFIIETDKGSLLKAPVSTEFVSFYITQDTQKHQLLPELLTEMNLGAGHFQVTGKVLTACSLASPLSGELVVENSAVPIRSIDIQLLRIESILTGERVLTDTSNLDMLNECRPFSVEFHVSIIISFQSELSKLYPKSDLRTPRPW